jgi:RNA polymerase sigma-70 factor (ECF subfamily)
MGQYGQTDEGQTRDIFPSTPWSLIQGAKASKGGDGVLMGLLLAAYWKPVYYYLLRRGRDREEAKDLTQDFFHEVVLRRRLVARAQKDKGPFRCLLFHALNQYLINHDRDQRARKRIPRDHLVPLDSADPPSVPPSSVEAPAEDSDREAWLSALLERVIAEVKAACRQRGLGTHWALFHERVLGPIWHGNAPRSLAELCEAHSINDVKKAANMIVTVKRRFRATLLEHIRNTVVSDDPTDEEFGCMLRFLRECAHRHQ